MVKTPASTGESALQGQKGENKDAAVNNLVSKLLHMYKFLEAELLDQNSRHLWFWLMGSLFYWSDSPSLISTS